jgi:fatty-acyl-CoA synthase
VVKQQRRTLAQVMDGLSARGEAPALITPQGVIVSYRSLSERADRLANELYELGLRRGQPFAFQLANGSRIVECYLACARSGLLGVPLSDRLTASDLAEQLSDSGATVLLYGAESAELVSLLEREERCPGVLISELAGAAPLDYESLLSRGSPSRPPVDPADADVLFVMYTGGSTGTSKAAMQTQESWGVAVHAAASQWALDEQDRHIITLPMDHVSWFTAAAILHVGGVVRIERRWDPDAVLELVERERITVLNVIPTMLGDLLERLDTGARRDLSSLRLITVGGSAMPVEMYRRAQSHFGSILACMYGMTETSGPVTYLLPHEMSLQRLRCVGRPHPDVELAILGDDGEPVVGEVAGEIALRGPQVSPGYLHHPQESAESFRGGWFLTGDVGIVDDEGFLFIVDRSKDMIKSGGFNVYPKEIEEVLYKHPDVNEAVVVGVADPRWIEAVHAVVSLKQGSTADEATLRDHCREWLPNYKVPKRVRIEQSLPRTSLGKLNKPAVREHLSRVGAN